MTDMKTISDIVAGHAVRNRELHDLLVRKGVSLEEPRRIECHFWAWSEADAARLAEALRHRGFEIIANRTAALADMPIRWNVEATVKQSIQRTIEREFTIDISTLANANGGVYDGWGTSV